MDSVCIILISPIRPINPLRPIVFLAKSYIVHCQIVNNTTPQADLIDPSSTSGRDVKIKPVKQNRTLYIVKS
ncbi:MAG TPA: hypothetical protein DIW30_05645 [Bacteroidales bacterium]|nr:hypothetical protein [Bacteroidales bacterium]